MTPVPQETLQCQEGRGLLRLSVDVGGRQVTAYVADSTLADPVHKDRSPTSLTERYEGRRVLIDAAVTRRVQSGAREPVVLRHSDL